MTDVVDPSDIWSQNVKLKAMLLFLILDSTQLCRTVLMVISNQSILSQK